MRLRTVHVVILVLVLLGGVAIYIRSCNKSIDRTQRFLPEATSAVDAAQAAADSEEPPPMPEPHGRYPGEPISQFLDHMAWSEANGGEVTIEDEHYLMALDATIRIVEGRKEHPEWRWRAVVARFMNWYPGNIEGRAAWRKYDKLVKVLKVLKKAGYKKSDIWPSATKDYDQMINSLEADGFNDAAKEYY